MVLMRCNICDAEMKGRTASKKAPYHYTLSGMEDVFLLGIDVLRCPDCSVESPIIPRVPELHRLIAERIVKKSAALTGQEIRFLRKNAEAPAKQFAQLIGVSPEHLSRVENGHYRKLGKSADRLVRVLASLAMTDEPTREALTEVAELFQARKQLPAKRVFRLSRDHWKEAA